MTATTARVPHVHAEVIKAWADGGQVETFSTDDNIWVTLSSPFFWNEAREYRVKPEKVYPVTQMTPNEMSMAFCNPNSTDAAREALANAALRHAIDADQVVPMAEVQEVARNLNKRRYERAERALLSAGFEDLGGQEWEPPLGKAPHFIEVHDPKRDMAIAVVVRDACRKPFESKYMDTTHWITRITAYGQVSSVDLAAAIAKASPC